MNNIPTAAELFNKYSSLCNFEEGNIEYLVDKEDFITALQEYAVLHVQACKNEIAENAEIKETFELSYEWTYEVDKYSILNCYPLTNIK